MNKTLKATLAALLLASMNQVAHAQIMGDENTSISGETIYIEEGTVMYEGQAGNATSLTISGAVGLPLNPTAKLPAKDSAGRVQVNYFDLFEAGVSDGKIYGIYAASRIGDTPLELSIGVGKLNSDNDVLDIDRTGYAVGVKYVFTDDEDQDPEAVSFAVGAGYNSALYRNKHAYVVASKDFVAGSRVVSAHLGARYDRFSVADIDSSKVSVYGGVEVPIDKRGMFNVVGEVQSKNASEDLGGAVPYSLSLRYQNPNGFAASAGIARQGVLADFGGSDSNGSRIFVQIGQTFN